MKRYRSPLLLLASAVMLGGSLAAVSQYYSSLDTLAFATKPIREEHEGFLMTAMLQKAISEGNSELLDEILDETFEDDEMASREEFKNSLADVKRDKKSRDRTTDMFVISSSDTSYTTSIRNHIDSDRNDLEIEVDSVAIDSNQSQIFVSFTKMKPDRDPEKSRKFSMKGSLMLKKINGRPRFIRSSRLMKFLREN